MGLQLPPGAAVMMKVEHQHIQGIDIQGCFGGLIQQPNGIKIITVGGISNLESLAADIYSNAVIRHESLGTASLTDLEYDPEKLMVLEERSIEAAAIFKRTLVIRAKEEAEAHEEAQSED